MTIITLTDDQEVIESIATFELRWELLNPEGVRPRRWQLMQKFYLTTYRLINSTGKMEAFTRSEEWRPVPISMPPHEIIQYSKAHAGFVPHELHIEGEAK